jgi:hypothetical protein
MSNLARADASTLLPGDVIMFEQDNIVKYGTVDRVMEHTSRRTLVRLRNVITENSRYSYNPLLVVRNDKFYKSDRVNEDVQVLDGTEPFANGVYIADLSIPELLKRNKKVDELTEEILANAKKLIDKPIAIKRKQANDSVDNTSDENDQDVHEDINEPKATSKFKPIDIKVS